MQSLGVGVTSLRPGTECKTRALVVVLAVQVSYIYLYTFFLAGGGEGRGVDMTFVSPRSPLV